MLSRIFKFDVRSRFLGGLGPGKSPETPEYHSGNVNEWLTVSGDMAGDKIMVQERHIRIVASIFEEIGFLFPPWSVGPEKVVISVSGPSGSGKSEVASCLASLLKKAGYASYVLSADNYPHRPPRTNENYREDLYQREGLSRLEQYLGTNEEIDFDRLRSIVRQFKTGEEFGTLRIIDNDRNLILDKSRTVNFRNLSVLVLEGTWSGRINEVDAKIFLATDFEKTLEHRRLRARDPLTPFGEIVLRVEQRKLEAEILDSVDLIVLPDGRVKKSVFRPAGDEEFRIERSPSWQ